MGYIKTVERWLDEYESDKRQLDALEVVMYEQSYIKGLDTSAEGGGSGRRSSCVENFIMEKEKVEFKANTIKKKITLIEHALESLEEKEREIIRLRDIEGRKWNYISRSVNYDYSWCRELRKRGLKKLCSYMFGEEVC